MKPVAPMTYLTTVSGGFHAKVLAARLGAEGIPAMLRGGVDGIYPIFVGIAVYVPAGQLETAREILLADAVDAAFHELEQEAPEEDAPRAPSLRRALAAVAVAVVVTLVLVGYLAAARVV
jgi:hypothetical protein